MRGRLTLAVGLALFGCGSNEGSVSEDGVAGSAGTGTPGGATTNAGTSSGGGQGGSGSGSGGGVANGGVANGGVASQGGAANAGASGAETLPPGVLDPALPEPSVDCRAATGTKRCVSISGQVAGKSLDAHCESQAIVNLVFESPKAWVADCTDAETQRQYQVTVPVQPLGDFEYTLAAGDAYAGVSTMVSVNDAGGSSLSDHFTGASVEGSVQDGGSATALVSGTFRARWGAPAVGCDGAAVTSCASAAIHGTFRILHSVGPGP
jgi:hypothetical protein